MPLLPEAPPLVAPPAVTGRFVRLVEMDDSHTPFIVRWRNQPASREWLPDSEPLTAARHRAWRARARAAGDLDLVALDREGQPIGQLSLYGFTDDGSQAEFGRLCFAQPIASPFAMVEAAALLHHVAFSALGLARVLARTVASNTRALALLGALGYRQQPDDAVTTARWGDRRAVITYELTAVGANDAALAARLYRGGHAPDVGADAWRTWRATRHGRHA